MSQSRMLVLMRWVFNPGIWWIRSRMKRSGSDVHISQMPSHGVLDRPVHSLVLTARSRVVGLGQSVLGADGPAEYVHAPLAESGFRPVPGQFDELNANTEKNRLDLIGHGFEHGLQEPKGRLYDSRFRRLNERDFGCSATDDEKKGLVLVDLHSVKSV